MSEAIINKITAGLQRAIGEDCGLSARLKLCFENGGIIFVDARRRPNQVTNEDLDADCVLTMTLDTFQKLLGGQIDGATAFMEGKLRVDGDMSIAMRVGPLLERQ